MFVNRNYGFYASHETRRKNAREGYDLLYTLQIYVFSAFPAFDSILSGETIMPEYSLGGYVFFIIIFTVQLVYYI